MDTRITCFVTLFLITIGFVNGQDLVCGTKASPRDIELMNRLLPKDYTKVRATENEVQIAITAHIVRKSDGTGGLTVSELSAAMSNLNQIYQVSNLSFFLFGEPNYIDDDRFYSFNSADEAAMTTPNNVENTINVYFMNSAVSNGNSLCGYAYFPASGRDHIIMVNSCTTNGSTFPHEIGHYFSLYHTHGKTNNGTTDELVNGSNCATAGDDLCDTAADPNLSGNVNAQCQYTGDDVDANNQVYNPNPKNLMSYSRKECRDEFSSEQASRITSAYHTFKTYLRSENYGAFFEVEEPDVCQGTSISFVNKSVNAISYQWTFEGGQPATSTKENPVVVYSTEGVFDVQLEITEAGGETDIKTIEDFISVRGEVSSDIEQKSGGFEEVSITETTLSDDRSTFELTTSVSTEGAQSVFMDFYNYSTVGAEDYLVFATLNTSTFKAFELTFDYAYAPYDDTYFDGLSILYRDPCDEWVTVWEKFGEDLKTRDATTSYFVPTADEWINQTVIFLIPEHVDVTEFAFKTTNGYGNVVYLDNYSINVSGLSFEIEELVVNGASCPDNEDGSVVINVSRVGDFQYSIDGENYSDVNEITGLAPGMHEVFVKNEIDLVESESFEVDFVNDYPSKPVIQLGDEELTVSITEGQTIRWYFNGGWLSSETSPTLNSPKRGTYEVGVFNGSCETVSDPFRILSTEQILGSRIKVYPNPVESSLLIQLPDELKQKINTLAIRDVSGRLITHESVSESVNVSNFKSGIYVIEFSGDDFVVTRRFLKR